MQRHAPRVPNLLHVLQARALVRVQTKVEQQLQHLWTVVRYRRRKQAAKRPEYVERRRIRQSAIGVTCPHPICVAQGHLRARAHQHLRQGCELRRTSVLIPQSSRGRKIEWRPIALGLRVHIGAVLHQPLHHVFPQHPSRPMQRRPSIGILPPDEFGIGFQQSDRPFLITRPHRGIQLAEQLPVRTAHAGCRLDSAALLFFLMD